MSRIFKSALVSLVVAAALAPATLAQPPAEPAKLASVRVAYGDLDMSTQTGGKILLRRIERAAHKACKRVTVVSPLQLRTMHTCQKNAVASAVRGLDLSTLTAAWKGVPPTALASR